MENWAIKEHWMPWKDIQGVWLNGEIELQNSLPYRYPPFLVNYVRIRMTKKSCVNTLPRFN